MTSDMFDTIFIAAQATSSPIAEKVQAAWPEARTAVVDDPAAFERKFEMERDPVAAGKRTLLVAPNRGRFIRKCPGTMGLVCCNYWVIDLAEGCAIDCSYCILQGYLNDRRIRLASNLDDLERELDEELAARPGRVRVGTGELSDSLMFDHELGLAQTLIDLFKGHPRATLELKTKTGNVDRLLAMAPVENVVIAWSMNTPAVIASDEKGAAPLDKRLAAAKRIAEAGWKVAFHFDPLVIHPGWMEGYQRVVQEMFDSAPPASIAWISLGAFRFHPSLKPVIHERFPESRILNAEFVLCPDRKMRYVKPVRRELFAALRAMIERRGPSVPLYLCMEGIEMWRAVFGRGPDGSGTLDRVFG